MPIAQVVELPLTEFFDNTLPGIAPDVKRLSLLISRSGGRRFCIFDIPSEPGFFSGFSQLFGIKTSYVVELRADPPETQPAGCCAWRFLVSSSRGPCFTIDHEGRLRGFSLEQNGRENFLAWIRRRADDPERPAAEALLDALIEDLCQRGVDRL